MVQFGKDARYCVEIPRSGFRLHAPARCRSLTPAKRLNRSLGYARDFGARLGRRASASTSSNSSGSWAASSEEPLKRARS